MDIRKNSEGKYLAVSYLPTKKKFRTTLTKDFTPSEASSIDDLRNVRTYSDARSLNRALRKYKDKL